MGIVAGVIDSNKESIVQNSDNLRNSVNSIVKNYNTI